MLSISEMPSGSPVGTMGVNKSKSAGIYAAMILANEFAEVRDALRRYKRKRFEQVLQESARLKETGLSGSG